MESEGLLPHSQEAATSPYPESAQYISCLPSQFLKIHINIIHPSIPISFKRSLSRGCPYQSAVCTSPVSHTCYIPSLFQSSWFRHPNNNNISRSLKFWVFSLRFLNTSKFYTASALIYFRRVTNRHCENKIFYENCKMIIRVKCLNVYLFSAGKYFVHALLF